MVGTRLVVGNTVHITQNDGTETVGTLKHVCAMQPIGQRASLRALRLAVAATNPDRIDLEKALFRWAQESYWLDDKFTATEGDALPANWRLGNRPNLTQIHREKKRQVEADAGLIAGSRTRA
jgi:hypothetical protein